MILEEGTEAVLKLSRATLALLRGPRLARKRWARGAASRLTALLNALETATGEGRVELLNTLHYRLANVTAYFLYEEKRDTPTDIRIEFERLYVAARWLDAPLRHDRWGRSDPALERERLGARVQRRWPKPATKERGGINPFTKEPVRMSIRPSKRERAGLEERLQRGRAKKAPEAAPPRIKVKRRARATRLMPPAQEWSPILLGVSAPRAVQPGESFTARFAAYIKEVEQEVTRQLTSMADVEASVGFSPDDQTRWKKGSSVSVRLVGEHFLVRPRLARFKWNGRQNLVHFQVKAKSDAPFGRTTLGFEASIAGVRVAFIAIELVIGEQSKASLRTATSTPIYKAFASYARSDTKRVTDTLSGYLARVRGTDIFLDCLSLRRGEDWKKQLEQAIATRDAFLLFWSKAAAKSKWVNWEWRRAHQKRKSMQAFRLDQPKPLLPKQLAHLHADDPFQVVRRAHGK